MEDLSQIPDYVLHYIAPMQCGEKERAELIRRKHMTYWTKEKIMVTGKTSY